MEDKEIIDLFISRSEQAIYETSEKYGKYCSKIAHNILYNQEDSEECVNDAYLNVWNAIPPTIPKLFTAFIGTITRNIALVRYRNGKCKKRGSGEVDLLLSELEECISSNSTVESTFEGKEIVETVNRFLANMNPECRAIFVQRYWYAASISQIASLYNMSESKVKSLLFRQRNRLREYLEEQDITF